MSWHDEETLSCYDDGMTMTSYGYLLRISERFMAMDGCMTLTMGRIVVG